jgi:choline dehydrogenase-like flavoprotein
MSADNVDVIVIGSGFGGSISTNRLALAGLKVLVLERGPWRDSLPVRSMGIEKRVVGASHVRRMQGLHWCGCVSEEIDLGNNEGKQSV